MKLLTPIQARLIKNENARLQIEEGVQIGRRVEQVRSALNKAQKEWSDFQTQTQNQILKSIDDLLDKKKQIEYQNQKLLERQEKLKEPLTKEWLRLKKEREALEQQKGKIESMALLTARRIDEISLSKKELHLLKKKLSLAEKKVAQDKATADKLLSYARSTQTDAQAQATNLLQESRQKWKEADEQKKLLARQEIDYNNRKQALAQQEELIKKRIIQIEDRYQTLLRVEKRLNDHRQTR